MKQFPAMEWVANIDFLDELRASGAVYYHHLDRIASALERLKYVRQVWLDHTCIIVVGTETRCPEIAARRVEKVETKVWRILNRYGKWAMDSKPGLKP